MRACVCVGGGGWVRECVCACMGWCVSACVRAWVSVHMHVSVYVHVYYTGVDRCIFVALYCNKHLLVLVCSMVTLSVTRNGVC